MLNPKNSVRPTYGIAIYRINQKLFSRAIVAHNKILILLKGYLLYNLQKKLQRMNSPTILDGLHNSTFGKHICLAYFSQYPP